VNSLSILQVVCIEAEFFFFFFHISVLAILDFNLYTHI